MEWSQIKGEAMCAASNRAEEIESTGFCQELQILGMKLQDLVFALLGFSCSFIQSFLAVEPHLHFRMGTFVLCHCRLEAHNLFGFYYTGVQSSEIACITAVTLLRSIYFAYFILFMCIFCLRVYLCTPYMPGAYEGYKSVSNSWELELQMVMNCHVGAEN